MDLVGAVLDRTFFSRALSSLGRRCTELFSYARVALALFLGWLFGVYPDCLWITTKSDHAHLALTGASVLNCRSLLCRNEQPISFLLHDTDADLRTFDLRKDSGKRDVVSEDVICEEDGGVEVQGASAVREGVLQGAREIDESEKIHESVKQGASAPHAGTTIRKQPIRVHKCPDYLKDYIVK
ncbi:hypothetical protein NDU88_005940 [Pleurodeles waltl]|uniref:Uncharacterized protein n=1 Tax=Pleurodeles waltl TaxID=8319 RepID=A0AAV7MKW9_PLEWA|nr:hypothetical protein NDU88_005940 [Pleurodeles waltl]